MAVHILIVDDSPAMRAFIRRVIGLSGFDATACLEASNGIEGLQVLEQKRVDVILADINMPVMDGEAFVRRLRESAALRSIPVLVTSTDGSEHRIQQMLDLGAKGYVKKPFLPETMREELERVIGIADARA